MNRAAGVPDHPGGCVWVFDVDGCLVDSMTGASLRPGARQALDHLRGLGHSLLLWSAGGADYARQRARQHGIHDLFDGFFGKEGRDEAGYYLVTHLPAGSGRMVFVDDRTDEIAPTWERVAVSPYIAGDPGDREMQRLLAPSP